MGAQPEQALFPRASTTRAVVDRLTARALASALACGDGASLRMAAEELAAIAGGDDLALALALQRVRRGNRAQPDSVVLERARHMLHLALAHEAARAESQHSQRVAVG